MPIAQSAKKPLTWILAVFFSAGLFLGLAQRPLLAQAADPDPDIHRINGKYFAKLGVDFGKVLISPIHWKGKDLLLFGGAVGTTGLVMAFLDHGTREWVEDHQKTSLTNFSLFITHLGEAPFLLGLSAVLYVGGEAFKNDGLRKTGLMSLESFCITGVVVNGMKYLIARARPLSGEGPSSLHWFSFKNNQHAFPSGHSSSAFAVAAVIAGQSDNFLVGAVSYGLASLVAISRVNNNEHWASDVVAGSIIGYFIGKEVLALNRPSGKNKPTLGFGPAPGGFALSLRF
jgi:membrane-associated phospholipid phosphatase